MTLVLADRVQETTTTTGTGSITTSGTAASQCQTFASGIGTGNTTYYSLLSGDLTNWETGIATITTSGSVSTIARTTILSSTNSGSAISLTGTSTVFCDLPASKVWGAGEVTALGSNLSLTSGSLNVAASPQFQGTVSTGPVVINSGATAPTAATSGTMLQVTNGSTGNARLLIDAFAGNAAFSGRVALGTPASPSALTANTGLMAMQAFGYNGSAYSGNQGAFSIIAAENWTTGAEGTYMNWQTTAAGGTTISEKMRLTSSGHLLVGTTTDDGTDLLQINGGTATVSLTATGTATLAAVNINSTGSLTGFGSNLSLSGGSLNVVASPTFTNLTATGTTKLAGTVTTNPVIINAGTHTPSSFPTATLLELTADSGAVGITVDTFAGVPRYIARRADGTPASPTAVQLNDTLFSFQAFAYGATGYSIAPRGVFNVFAGENWTDTSQGAYINFQTTPTGGTATAEAFRASPSGHLLIGTTTDDGTNKLQVNGGAQITTLAVGASTGPTITSGTGVPSSTQPNASLFMRTDGTTGSRLYVSAGGGTWAAVSGV